MGVKELLQSIEEKQEERKKLLATLHLWSQVQGQQIRVSDVKCFGFDERLLTSDDLITAYKAAKNGEPDPVTGYWMRFGNKAHYRGHRLYNGKLQCIVYNYVRFHSGEKIQLKPMLKAPV
jgi:hypothetical protein